MSATPEASARDAAQLLNEACRRVVSVAVDGDPDAIAALADRLEERAKRAGPGMDPRRFLGALAALLRGKPVDGLVADLPAAWHGALGNVARDIAAPPLTTNDAVASLSARVAHVMQRRDREGARQLSGELARLSSSGTLDEAQTRFLRVLDGMLAGRDVRHDVLALQGIYVDAYRSLEHVLRGADPRAGLIERVRDNTLLVLRDGDDDTRARFDAAMAEVEGRAIATGEHELGDFVSAARALVRREPIRPIPTWTAPDLVAAWQELVRKP